MCVFVYILYYIIQHYYINIKYNSIFKKMDLTTGKGDPEGMVFSVEIEKLYKGDTLTEENR